MIGEILKIWQQFFPAGGSQYKKSTSDWIAIARFEFLDDNFQLEI